MQPPLPTVGPQLSPSGLMNGAIRHASCPGGEQAAPAGQPGHQARGRKWSRPLSLVRLTEISCLAVTTGRFGKVQPDNDGHGSREISGQVGQGESETLSYRAAAPLPTAPQIAGGGGRRMKPEQKQGHTAGVPRNSYLTDRFTSRQPKHHGNPYAWCVTAELSVSAAHGPAYLQQAITAYRLTASVLTPCAAEANAQLEAAVNCQSPTRRGGFAFIAAYLSPNATLSADEDTEILDFREEGKVGEKKQKENKKENKKEEEEEEEEEGMKKRQTDRCSFDSVLYMLGVIK
ncbi:unnamed protein product [Pleuronectes platessa]|uniref:Uncharacterized protein n=1 Tax=Pleuronectes platessa TaxID=8262 RepID=A0A9N7UY37_PLEPL|nr:unnamed protein product [Pleuronectes platessa]